MERHIARMALKYPNVCFAKYDCELEGNEELASELGVKELPTVIAFREGEQVRRFLGASAVGEIMGLAEVWDGRYAAEASNGAK
uniref:Thioredoxin (Allergen cop c 2) n=1 Tax=Tetraselmis sp. GSL018 TaxID=582737 RepID=A0A061SGT9_9CHLO|mmetsp:Transcript_26966/g.63978  ORF Transcript_26966/g.63978 Transcript_26966/m.63978 type:complete len:84 (+) Transcript_26966:1055-1306(+)